MALAMAAVLVTTYMAQQAAESWSARGQCPLPSTLTSSFKNHLTSYRDHHPRKWGGPTPTRFIPYYVIDGIRILHLWLEVTELRCNIERRWVKLSNVFEMRRDVWLVELFIGAMRWRVQLRIRLSWGSIIHACRNTITMYGWTVCFIRAKAHIVLLRLQRYSNYKESSHSWKFFSWSLPKWYRYDRFRSHASKNEPKLKLVRHAVDL